MVESISYLNIKPYETYTDGKARQTTLTSFENVLHKEEKGTVASKEQTDTEKTDTDKTAKIDDSAKQVVFVNPANGQKVIYEDVAKEAKKTAASSNTTTADSMKTTKYDSIFKKAAKKYNVSELHLSCFDANTSGLLLYTKLGYKPYEIEKYINKENEVSALIELKKVL